MGAGDKARQDFEDVRRILAAVIRRRFRDHPECDDLISEAWIGAWKAAQRFDFEKPRQALLKAGVWAAVAYARRGHCRLCLSVNLGVSAAHPIALAGLAAEELIGTDGKPGGVEPDFSTEIIERIARRQLLDETLPRLLPGLTEQQRRLLKWYYVDGFSVPELQRLLNLRREGVDSALFRLRARLQALQAGSFVSYRIRDMAVCGAGHPLDPERVRIDSQGRWQCKECTRLRQRRYFDKLSPEARQRRAQRGNELRREREKKVKRKR